MTKSDLKDGMVVEIRNGNRYMVLKETFLRQFGYVYFSSFTDDLMSIFDHRDFDIVKVFNPPATKMFDTLLGIVTDLYYIWEIGRAHV